MSCCLVSKVLQLHCTFQLPMDKVIHGLNEFLSAYIDDLIIFSASWEERYSTIEKECLAIKLGMLAFRMYLLGRRFTFQTDHWSLVDGQVEGHQCSSHEVESIPAALRVQCRASFRIG